jgi:hypothetical protein
MAHKKLNIKALRINDKLMFPLAEVISELELNIDIKQAEEIIAREFGADAIVATIDEIDADDLIKMGRTPKEGVRHLFQFYVINKSAFIYLLNLSEA